MTRISLKLQAGVTALFLAGAVVLLQQGAASAAGTDPNITQRVEQFIWKPQPQDLLLKPKPKKHPKSQPKDAKD
jgi:hypothetical protein